MARQSHVRNSTIVVAGLGRFGTAVAHSLIRTGHEVLGIDASGPMVQRLADTMTHVVQADSTNVDTLRQLGVQDVDVAIVGIGSDIEASVLTVLALVDLNVKTIWAKATNERHGRILERTGAHHVVYPEARMGQRVAHIVTGKVIDFIEFDDGFALVKTRTPRSIVGKTLAEASVRSRFGVTIVGIKRPREDFTYARPETIVEEDALLIVAGNTAMVERFAAID